MTSTTTTLRLSPVEGAAYRADGFVVREGAFHAEEVEAVRAECEALTARLVSESNGRRRHVGSYVFEPQRSLGVTIKWEGDSDVVHGLEPLAHLSRPLHDWAYDPRFVDPMRDIVGDPDPVLFTEKLNLKRPVHGGVNPPHQDYPYWDGVADDAGVVATAMLFLDSATEDNGCLEVLPGSHRHGLGRPRADGDEMARNELDRDHYARQRFVSLPVPAGTVVFFGSMLIHRSAPNRSTTPRAALLYSYQPNGHRHLLDYLRGQGLAR